MITPVFSNRRAERFAQLLDEAAGARRRHARSAADGDLTELVAMSQRVSTVPLVVEVDPEFRTGLRASLMAHIEREGIGATVTVPADELAPQRRLIDLLPTGRTRKAVVVAVTAGAFGAFGVSAASGDAIPGDALYGVKRSTERAQLAFAGSAVSRGQLYFEFAKVRLAEAGAIGSDAPRLDRVLDDMDQQTRNGTQLLTTAAVERGEVAGLQAIQLFVGQQRPTVQGMVNRLKGPSRKRAVESLSLLDAIGKRAAGLTDSAKCPGQDSPVDELGAVPVACAEAITPPRQPATPPTGAARAPQVPPAGSTAVGPAVGDPTDTMPSVEAGSSAAEPTPDAHARATTGPQGPAVAPEPEDGVMDKLESLVDKLFG